MLDRKVEKPVALQPVDDRDRQIIMVENLRRLQIEIYHNRTTGFVNINSQGIKIDERTVSVMWNDVVFECTIVWVKKRLAAS